MIRSLIAALKEEDPRKTVSCFEDSFKTEYIDYCSALAGQKTVYLRGKNALSLFFEDVFYDMNRFFYISEEEIEDDRNATFFACYRGKYVLARLTIEGLSENGKISKAVIRPV